MRSALLAGLVFSASAFGTTYQVGAGKQFAQLAQANAVAGPGDIVEVDGNATYNAVHWTASGTVAAPITIRGVKVNGARPHLAGGTNTIEMEGSHVVVEGFELTGGTSRCFFHHADDVTLRDSVVHDCPLQGILGADQDSGSLTLEYVEVHHCGSGTQNHQIYMATDEVAHPGAIFHMRFCYLHDANGGNNVKSRAERNEIFYNWIEGATYHELELIGPDPEGAQSSWTEALKREDSDVVGNVLRKTQTTFVVRFGGDGTGASKGRFRFVNNTVITASGGSAVFRLFSGIESVEMHNNVFVAAAGTVNLVRAATDEVEWVSGQRISGTNNWVQTGGDQRTDRVGWHRHRCLAWFHLARDLRFAADDRQPVDQHGRAGDGRADGVFISKSTGGSAVRAAGARVDCGRQRGRQAGQRCHRHRRLRSRRRRGWRCRWWLGSWWRRCVSRRRHRVSRRRQRVSRRRQ